MDNNLLEAAAEILSKSKGSAVPAMPMPKYKDSYHEYKRGDINTDDAQDLGGDVPSKREFKNPDYTPGMSKTTTPGTQAKVGAAPMPSIDKEYGEYDNSEDDPIETDEIQHIGGGNDYTKGMKRLSTVTNTAPTKGMPMPKLKTESVDKERGEAQGLYDDEYSKHQKKLAAARGGARSPDESADHEKSHKYAHAIMKAKHPNYTASRGEGHVERSYGAPPMKEDIEAIFAGETLSEEFKEKTATIFEARVHDRVTQIQEELEASYAQALEESMNDLTLSVTEKVNDYLNYVVEEWMNENSIAVEKGLRTELTEDFMVGLRNLFTENFIDIPEERVDIVEELSEKVSELEDQLNEQIDFGIQLRKELNESRKNEVIHAITEGLTDTQVEKIKTLAESVEFTTEVEYSEKLETIRENYFPSGVKRTNELYLHETVDDEQSDRPKVTDPRMAAYFNTITRTLPR